MIVVILYGERGAGSLLILSQVILSLQLPVRGVSAGQLHRQPAQDGGLRRAGVDAGAGVDGRGYHCGLNVWLLYQTFAG